MSLKKILFKFSLILIIFSVLTGKSFSLEPKDFVQSVVDEASSVLSKKIAAGSKYVVIDIPIGPTAKIRSKHTNM